MLTNLIFESDIYLIYVLICDCETSRRFVSISVSWSRKCDIRLSIPMSSAGAGLEGNWNIMNERLLSSDPA